MDEGCSIAKALGRAIRRISRPCITPLDELAGRAEAIRAERDCKLDEARERRKARRAAARPPSVPCAAQAS